MVESDGEPGSASVPADPVVPAPDAAPTVTPLATPPAEPVVDPTTPTRRERLVKRRERVRRSMKFGKS